MSKTNWLGQWTINLSVILTGIFCFHAQTTPALGQTTPALSQTTPALGQTTPALGQSEKTDPAARILPAEKNDGSAGQALSLLFDSRRAPTAKSMGLLQGNFLDAIEVSGSLQLAIVIDSSESMDEQLDSIRENLQYLLSDLDRLLDGSVEITVVTFSDVGQKKIPVTFSSKQFVDAKSAQALIKSLPVSTGKPFFHEAVDLGIQRAIGDLPWSEKPNVERWILLIGDAPPYPASYDDPKTGAKRWYETQRLVDLANQKNIHIHCLLCESRDSERDSFEKLLDDTRSFMGKLSTSTGGLMLDLSYTQVRKALAESASRSRSQYVRIGTISQTDIENALGPATAKGSSDQSQRIIVAPFLSWDNMTFFHERPEVQIAIELGELLKQLPNTRVIPPRQLEEQIDRLKTEGVPEKDWPQALCFRLHAQAIVSGQMKNANQDLSVTVELRAPHSQQPLASTKLTAQPQKVARQILGQLGQIRNPPAAISTFVARIQQHATEQQIDMTEVGALSKLKQDDRRVLLAGLTALEQSLGYHLGDPGGISLLESAETSLQRFLLDNPRYPYALMLLSNAQFNLAAAHETLGDVDQSRTKFGESTRAIQQAFQSRNDLVDELLKLELDGDYHLLVRQEFETSVDRYQKIVAHSTQSPVNSALHAHWMLAGIRSGDWGVSEDHPQVVDLGAAREHLIQILAYWPESSQADLIRKNLMWDPQTQQTRSPFLAHAGVALVPMN